VIYAIVLPVLGSLVVAGAVASGVQAALRSADAVAYQRAGACAAPSASGCKELASATYGIDLNGGKGAGTTYVIDVKGQSISVKMIGGQAGNGSGKAEFYDGKLTAFASDDGSVLQTAFNPQARFANARNLALELLLIAAGIFGAAALLWSLRNFRWSD